MPEDTKLLGGLRIDLAVSSGIPEAVAATMNYATRVRETMDAETRLRWDRLNLWIAEQFWGLFGYRP